MPPPTARLKAQNGYTRRAVLGEPALGGSPSYPAQAYHVKIIDKSY